MTFFHQNNHLKLAFLILANFDQFQPILANFGQFYPAGQLKFILAGYLATLL